MNITRKLFLALLLLLSPFGAFADEGMFVPLLLGRHEGAMQAAGMHLSAKDIYDANHASLKDAVVLFGGGCTGEFISSEGLLLTNHHCGYSHIVKHSTVEHDYLTGGFWAMSREEEIPCPGLEVERLVRMEDVTALVLAGIGNNVSERVRDSIVSVRIRHISDSAVQGTHYRAVIKPFYFGNQYFMYVNEVFTDVRLVGAPPSNIGKFGGDTDNWMWPRHTGDFSMFRVYAAADGTPRDYQKDNVPYHPKKHLTISTKGVNEGDFTFVFGFPGRTYRYVTSDAVELDVEQTDPICISFRDIRLKHYKNAMEQSPALRLRYANVVAGIANGWKKWQGELQGVERRHLVQKKREQESRFQEWSLSHTEFSDVLPSLHQEYERLKGHQLATVYMREGFLASDFMYICDYLYSIAKASEADANNRVQRLIAFNHKRRVEGEKTSPVDRSIFVDTYLKLWKEGHARGLAAAGTPEEKVRKKLEDIFDDSMVSNPEELDKYLSKFSYSKSGKLLRDPGVALAAAYHAEERIEEHKIEAATGRHAVDSLMRQYLRGQMAMYADSVFFPDANLTLRVAYGHAEGFRPKDGVRYECFSTLDGIMEKEDPNIYDYVVEPRLKELYAKKDYGRYANAEGELPVCFIATNHTTGGNSGSPVMNADGELIGINFDRCWEGTMSDYMFDPTFCRNISLDIRYCLFLIDKFAGAGYLLKEMTLK